VTPTFRALRSRGLQKVYGIWVLAVESVRRNGHTVHATIVVESRHAVAFATTGRGAWGSQTYMRRRTRINQGSRIHFVAIEAFFHVFPPGLSKQEMPSMRPTALGSL